jgi:Domain of unknown function (DUF6265)
MKKILIFFLFILSFSCKQKTTSNPKINLDWLIGCWVYTDEMGDYTETWEKKGSNTYNGNAIQIKGKDTTFAESMKLDSIQLVVKMIGQNEDKAVAFPIKNSTDSSVIFENLAHDFPQRIVYSKPNKDSITAYIEGKTKEGNNRIYFKMRRK